ncbi:MAG: Uma2 family endonuclease, partial [Anaerolineae bacterium]|nr:Uma2 family endonuclease [Anaerolineae bacterium]
STRSRPRLSSADYARLGETNRLQELIDGELIMSPSPSDAHQEAVPRLWLLLTELTAGAGKVKIAPMDVYLAADQVVQPDVFWGGAAGSACQLDAAGHWQGPPDLIVEILSPYTEKQDRGRKYDLYERVGVREYWLVQPEVRFVEVYTLVAGRYQRQGIYGPEETFASPVLNAPAVAVSRFF